ncbi:hypothetical protein [Sphingomonas sp.]|uniref:hypothetical protein n=1 Tax=Sphingomonas sp. TaxID=28214 RepID=UPI0035AE9381
MIHIYVFHAFQTLVCIYALVAGGKPERAVAVMLLVASFATLALPFDAGSFHALEVVGLIIDLGLMGGLVAVALVANRFWPLWLAAIHLLAIGIHGVKALDAGLMPWMYAGAGGKLAYPMLIILAAGVMRHRTRIVRQGSDPDWSWRVEGGR